MRNYLNITQRIYQNNPHDYTTMNRYNLISVDINQYACTDNDNGITCTFVEHKFNETQQFAFGPRFAVGKTANEVAKIMAEMADWLHDNHYNIAMPNVEHSRIRLGKRLRELRESNGVSQDRLGELSGLARSHISRIEGGKYNTTTDIFERLISVLGYQIEFVEKDVDK